MKTSIIINTYNRAAQLKDCLQSLNHLKGDFEVIVVNGPSTDQTVDICKTYNKKIKYVYCPERNLSVSRNIGIANSQGDIVAFIDDDAIVHPMWLKHILQNYSTENVAGVGGFTIDHTGKKFQATGTLCDRMGNSFPVTSAIPRDIFCFPGTILFPSLLGTNSSFRRSALEKIGGFDEIFAYFLDETDVCLRLIDAGGVILYAPNALIFHKYASSHLRNLNKVPTTLHVQSRSKSYFCYRHGESLLGKEIVQNELNIYKSGLLKSNEWLKEHNHISLSTETLLNLEVEIGINDGYRLALLPAPTNLKNHKTILTKEKFKTFNSKDNIFLEIVIVSQGYPPTDTAGIARWTELVSKGLAEKGHCVHVITRSELDPAVDYENGIWIHRIKDANSSEIIAFSTQLNLPQKTSEWSAAVFEELQLIGLENIDLVSAPIWDVEGLVTLLLAQIPVVTSLHTTYKLAKPFKPDWNRPLYEFSHIDKLIAAENFIFNNGLYFLGNTNSVVEEINNLYEVNIASRTIVVPHGVSETEILSVSNESNLKTILFVGRQEYRKGFDTALRAAVQVCKEVQDVRFKFIGSNTNDPICSETLRWFIENFSNFKDRIIIEGYVNDNYLSQCYAECDIFLCPSRFESFGLVAIEAMRFGKPLVAGKVGGLKEVVNSNVGILVDPNSENEIKVALITLLNDDQLIRRMSKASKNLYFEKYTLNHMVNGVENAFREFIFQHNNLTKLSTSK
jgi:glycosyltransferase involved in cell wall biosynthesis/GT2 family glycosyltransferase